jgi:hypothetical protein
LFIFFISNKTVYGQFDNNAYEALLREAKQQYKPQPSQQATEEKKFDKNPISPMVIGRFWCDPEIKVNTVRQEVMTNTNYIK